MASDSEEEDYMKMTFSDQAAGAAPETSLQRRQRERREAAARGQVKSKAEVAAEEKARREEGLSRSLLVEPAARGGGPSASKGLAMMARMGFRGGALGAPGNEGARAEPLRVELRVDREGIGADADRKRKAQEEAQRRDTQKAPRFGVAEYRDRVRRMREAGRLDRLVEAAQRVAERMDDEAGEEEEGREEKNEGEEAGEEGKEDEEQKEKGKKKKKERRKGAAAARPLKSINVLWRGPVRAREEAERDRRMRHDLEQSLSRLPTYEDDLEDDDDRMAMGKTTVAVHAADEDLDDEDPELDEFNALEPEEKLRRLVLFLRQEHRYCFWCKFAYPDAAMAGCPGLTEEDHD